MSITSDGKINVGVWWKAAPPGAAPVTVTTLTGEQAGAFGSVLVMAARIAHEAGGQVATEALSVDEAESLGKTLLTFAAKAKAKE